jgi:hypothetical protein
MSTHLLLALGLALLAGCASSSSPTGSAQLAVSLPQALSSSVSRVSVTLSATDFSSLSVDLVSSNGVWGGILGSIPAGANRTFLAQAFDASGTRLFQGSASGVSIVANQTALVALTLQQVDPPPPSQNEAPFIDSLVASSTSTSVPAGGSLSLVATAHDPNPGDTLSFAWSSTAGSFSSASEATTSWTAPASSGFQTLTFTVTDSQGLSTSVSLTVYVTPSRLQGGAQFSITFNSFPQVASLGTALTRVAVGQTTSVSASALDLDGDSLSYSWSASCAGAWANASSPSAQFTPDTLPADTCNNCRLMVSVTDGRGGQTTGTVALCVISPPGPKHFNPFITSASGSSSTASPAQVLHYEVTASDPEGSALSFSWFANTGALGTPDTDASSSRTTWTAPSCVTASTPARITATVTNAFHLTDTRSFVVTGLPLCVRGWASTGSMASTRVGHTATLLNNGKVLVTGGVSTDGNSRLATAEVYDPAAGTWSTTGALASPRVDHTATLLPNGKVLISGGTANGYLPTAEVYDPASGTWSETASMSSPRTGHTATLLNNGKVLVTGGYGGESGNLATAEVYAPISGTWSSAASMDRSFADHTATLLPNGKVLVTGWDLWTVYDPERDSWSMAGSMASSHSVHSATLLNNGKVLISGGTNTTAELYDPASGTWSVTGSMALPHNSPRATTLLPNGKVLVAGGFNDESLSTSEVYDPASGTWSPAGSQVKHVGGHTATLLNNGQVLVAGGYPEGGPMVAELYTP